MPRGDEVTEGFRFSEDDGDDEDFGYRGGGGSSYSDAVLCTDVVHTQGTNAGNGYIRIVFIPT